MEEQTWWHTDDHHSPNLSKASLGDFFHACLTCGIEIGKIWVFNRKYPRCSVFVSVKANETQKAYLEEHTRYRLRKPPVIHLNSSED